MKYPQGTLETKFGTVRFTMTSADHVHLSTETNKFITVFGVNYDMAYHCELIADKWQAKTYHEPYLSRIGGKEPSLAARKAVREIVADAWAEYVAMNPVMVEVAERCRLESEIEQLDSRREELGKQLADLGHERAGLVADLNKLNRGAA